MKKTITEWITYFRNNPFAFAEEYLGIKLTRGQKRKINKLANKSPVGLRDKMGCYDDYAGDEFHKALKEDCNK